MFFFLPEHKVRKVKEKDATRLHQALRSVVPFVLRNVQLFLQQEQAILKAAVPSEPLFVLNHSFNICLKIYKRKTRKPKIIFL